VIHLFFAKDKFCRIDLGKYYYKFGWFNIDFNSSKQARFYGIPLDFIGNKRKLKDVLKNSYRFIFWFIVKFLKSVAKISVQKFDYINGYTSSIVLFCFLQRKTLF
jgi:phenylacetate-CoA ligase